MNKLPIWLLGLATALLALGCSEETPTGLEKPPAGLQPSASISIVPASPFTGPEICKAPSTGRDCVARPFDTTDDLAFPGNGFALPAVARDVIAGFAHIHQAEFANDGFYGNGASWIGILAANSWLKIDLGQTVSIGRITFGRDRTGGFDGREPGQFTIEVASSDNVYAIGDDTNDATEYTQVFNSADFGFSGEIDGPQTVQASFTPVLTRFVKLTFTLAGAAIDEVEIFEVVAFAAFDIERARVETDRGPGEDRFEVRGSFELGATSNGIDVLSEDVIVTFDGFSETIPAGSFFRDDDDEGFQFDGSSPGIKRIDIRDDGEFRVKGRDVDLSGIDLSNPVPFSLQIGNDVGETEIQFDDEGEFEADD